MLKNSPILLAGGVMVALVLTGCHKDDAESADTTPAAVPTRPTKPAAGAPGMGAKPAPGAPGVPGAGKGAQAAGKGGNGKADPFSPQSGGKAGDKMQAKGKGDNGKMAGAKGTPNGTGAPGGVTPAAPPAAGTLGGGPAPAQGTPAAPGTPPAPGTPAAPGTPGAPGTKIASIQKHPELDPFKVTWHKVPPPPYVFDSIQPMRLASAEVEVPPPGEINIRELANRRVSGIMSGDGVFAILESAEGGDPIIVKPGSMTPDGYRVASISSDSVKLQRKDGNVIRTQIVPLTDASPSQQSNSGGLFGGRGGNRGGFPGSSGGPAGSGGFGGSGGGRQRPGVSPGGGSGKGGTD